MDLIPDFQSLWPWLAMEEHIHFLQNVVNFGSPFNSIVVQHLDAGPVIWVFFLSAIEYVIHKIRVIANSIWDSFPETDGY